MDVFLGLRQIGKSELTDPDERRVGCGIVWDFDETGSMVVRGLVPRGPASQVRSSAQENKDDSVLFDVIPKVGSFRIVKGGFLLTGNPEDLDGRHAAFH